MGAALLPTALVALWGYMIATKTPLHPSASDVPSVTLSAPSPKWVGAVERARVVARMGITEQNLPGLSVAVGVGDEVVWSEGFGWANLESRVSVSPATPFRIGSASQALTSAAVGLLLEKGLLRLDEEIQTFVPAFPRKQWPVTLRHLMSHLAGIRPDNGDEERLTERCGQTTDGLRRFADYPLLRQPGTRYHVSNYGWILVSAAVEAAAGEPFFSYMRTQIFDRLGMNNTKADSGRTPIPDRAIFYFPKFAADPSYGPQDPWEPDYSCFSGASAFLSTPSDLVRYAMAINNGKLLQPATVALLQTSQRTASGVETGYGLGWDIEAGDVAGAQTHAIGHNGEVMGGTVSSFMTFPEHGIVVAVTANTAFAKTFPLAVSIAQAFAEPGKTRQP